MDIGAVLGEIIIFYKMSLVASPFNAYDK